MPNIRDLSAPSDLGLRPDDRADQALANSGRRIAALYSTAAETQASTGRRIVSAIEDVGNVAVKAAERQEISSGAAKSAETLAGLDALWNKTVKDSDPNDPTTAAKFREEVVEPTLEKLRSGFLTEGGTRFAESTVEKFRNHFVSKTTADMATMAGIAAKKNVETLTNQLSNAAIRDPSSLKTSLDLVEHSVGAMVDASPNLSGVDAARVKLDLTLESQKAIVKAAAIGAIAANPEEGLKKFSSEEYSKYISGAELRQLEQQSKAVIRAERVDENYRRQNKIIAEKEASDAREGQYLQKLYSGDPKAAGSVSARAIANDFTLSREARERMISLVNRETKPETNSRISQQTFVGLLREMRDPNADPDAVMNKAWEARLQDPGTPGSMTERDFNQFRQELVARKTPEGAAIERDRTLFFKQYAGAIAGRAYDPVIGSPKLYKAEMDARRIEADLRKKGLDPHLAYDPSSEYYLGKPERIRGWGGSMQDDLGDKAEPPPGAKRNDAMPAIPPAAQRDVGGIYDTPKGKLKWTGTGWVKP